MLAALVLANQSIAFLHSRNGRSGPKRWNNIPFDKGLGAEIYGYTMYRSTRSRQFGAEGWNSFLSDGEDSNEENESTDDNLTDEEEEEAMDMGGNVKHGKIPIYTIIYQNEMKRFFPSDTESATKTRPAKEQAVMEREKSKSTAETHSTAERGESSKVESAGLEPTDPNSKAAERFAALYLEIGRKARALFTNENENLFCPICHRVHTSQIQSYGKELLQCIEKMAADHLYKFSDPLAL